ncbi:MAG: DNA primase [Chloroflexota bacterium]|nr:DNA primase [Chloroflexota bacterium]
MSVVDEIKERLDIVDVISAYVPLRKAGRSYKALCPFHQEKTPSFVVYQDRGYWHCYGACGEGGDIISFIQKRENVDFREALEILAAKAGISLEPPSEAQSEQAQYLDKLREINHAASVYFHSMLQGSAQGQTARDYLTRRGLDETTIEQFSIGYAADSWDGLLNHLRERSYQLEDILAAGLIIQKDHDDGRVSHYDRFRDRVIIPIRDVGGRTIGFGARALQDDQIPKYLNTPQTPLFDKSSVLFGLDMARREIRARGHAIIVEGYMDVLAAHQFGEPNLVASMGTALTEQQLKKLKRYTKTFILALDADTAGQAATLRGISQAREALDREWVPTVTARGLLRHEARLAAELRIMTLPEGKDPDDVIRSDPDQWRRLVEEAQPVVDYFMGLVKREVDLKTARGKTEAVDRLAPLVKEVANDIQRTHYIQQLARLVQTDERSIRSAVFRQRSVQPPRPTSPPLPGTWEDAEEEDYPAVADVTEQQIRPQNGDSELRPSSAVHCLAHLVKEPKLLPLVQTELSSHNTAPLDEEDFPRSDLRAICAGLLSSAIQENGEWPGADPVVAQLLEQLVQYGKKQPPLQRQQLVDDIVNTVIQLRIDALLDRTRELPVLCREARDQGQSEEARAIQQILNDAGGQLRVLQQTRFARTHTGRRQTNPKL